MYSNARWVRTLIVNLVWARCKEATWRTIAAPCRGCCLSCSPRSIRSRSRRTAAIAAAIGRSLCSWRDFWIAPPGGPLADAVTIHTVVLQRICTRALKTGPSPMHSSYSSYMISLSQLCFKSIFCFFTFLGANTSCRFMHDQLLFLNFSHIGEIYT